MAPSFTYLTTASLLVLLTLLPSRPAEYSIDDTSLFRINFAKRLDLDIDLLHRDSFASPPAVDTTGDTLPPLTSDPLAQSTGDSSPHVTGDSPPSAKARDDAPEELERVVMTTTNHERYSCAIPRNKGSADNAEQSYSGPNVLEILQSLFVTQACAYRLEHYWTYELCHGRHVRQFHGERDGKNIKLTEYYLGKYDSDTFGKDVAYLKQLQADGALKKPHKKRIETMNMPFFELTMRDGTICDLNGQPRVTRVNYVCYPAGKHEMYSFKEASTCEYDIIVLSPTLCNHPDYQLEESKERVIDCRPLDERTPYKPRNLLQIEVESLKLRSERMFEGEFMQGDLPGSVKIEIKQVTVDDLNSDEDLEDEAEQFKDANWPSKQSSREPFKPMMDPAIVKEFLMGEYCLYGGTGWWKYEFCYGKKVDQYHEERDGKKTVINLGRFDVAEHEGWIQKHPGKRPKPVDQRKHVSHFYSGGDMCDLTKTPRSVEVKLKCKKSDSPSAVSLYLLEPRTCEYVLGVESPLVCDIIHTADEQTGLMTLSKDNFAAKHAIDSAQTKPPNGYPEKDHEPASQSRFDEFVQHLVDDATGEKAEAAFDHEAFMYDHDGSNVIVQGEEEDDGDLDDDEDEQT